MYSAGVSRLPLVTSSLLPPTEMRTGAVRIPADIVCLTDDKFNESGLFDDVTVVVIVRDGRFFSTPVPCE
jgi:hypothetical protein